MSTIDSDANAAAEESQADSHAGQGLLERYGLGGHKATYDDINVPVILMIGFISTVLTFVAIVGVQALYYSYQNDEITKKSYGVVNTPESAIVDEQKAKLQTYGWTVQQVDTEDGKAEITRVTVPIEYSIPTVLEREAAAQKEAFPDEG